MRLFYRFTFIFLNLLLAQNKLFAQFPFIVTSNVPTTSICSGTNLSVAFLVSNVTGNSQYTVQLSNASGSFTFSTPTVLATGTSSPIVVTIPANTPVGDYRIRVITDVAGVTYVPSESFTLLHPATATIKGDTTIIRGGSATLTVQFTGSSPWTYTFTNTNTGTTSTNPLLGAVQPTVSTTYALQSVSNACGAGTVAGSARVKVLPIINASFTPTSLCAGASSSVAFTQIGSFDTTQVTYTAQLSNATGSFSSPTSIGIAAASPISVVMPANLAAGTGYRIRVVASAAASSNTTNAFTIKPLPTAIISGTTTIGIGDSTNLSLAFTGEAPWTYQISGRTAATTTTTPTTVRVAPTTTTNYTLTSISNACGIGTMSGNALITVIPRISVAELALGSVCAGVGVSLPFTVSGTFSTAVTYTAQLSDGAGSFASPLSLGTASSSPINITLPTTLPAGSLYRIRVIASAPASSVSSEPFILKVRPSASISGNTTINFGENTSLVLTFSGEGPWTYTLSDGSTGSTSTSPLTLNLTPSQTTAYTITSVKNACGEGTATGSATVTVIPRIMTEDLNAGICSGKETDIKFTIGGSLPANTVFQAQLSDKNGSFANPTIIGTANQSPIRVSIPTTLEQNGKYQIRTIAINNAAIVSVPSAPFSLALAPTAVLSGGGNFPIKPGEEFLLIIQLGGDGPWTYVLSDNTTATTSTSPAIVTVKPDFPTTYTLKSVSNGCGTGTVSGSATANVIITSINTTQPDIFTVFPNPSTNQLYLKTSHPKAQEWELLDLQGRLIQKRQWDMRPDFEDTIDIRNLPLGTYLIRVRIENQWLHKKIIKK